MINFNINNLNKSLSPYLQQHKDNPIHWQEWSQDVLDYAKKNNKPLFVSIGYSTCHWCHVMASEAFSNEHIASYLNSHYVSIKVDRELRPDIDQYCMAFIQETQGHGGWPLNVFMNPDKNPILAITYLPMFQSQGMPSFFDVIVAVQNQFTSGVALQKFTSLKEKPPLFDESSLIQTLSSHFDPINGGFGYDQKFPPHSTLLFLLQYYSVSKDDKIAFMIKKNT